MKHLMHLTNGSLFNLSIFAVSVTATLLCAPVAAQVPGAKAAPVVVTAPSNLSGLLALEGSAGRLPVVAERLTKVYAEMHYGIKTDRARRSISELTAQFDRELEQLTKAAPNVQIRQQYDALRPVWIRLRSALNQPPTLALVNQIIGLDDDVVRLARAAEDMIVAMIASPKAKMLEDAAEVRLIVQRMAKLQIMRAVGVQTNTIDSQLKVAETEYRKHIERLLKSPDNVGDISRELRLEESQWLFLKGALAKANGGNAKREDLEVISKTADNIVEIMDRVAKRLEQV
jgi:hypothetical protein